MDDSSPLISPMYGETRKEIKYIVYFFIFVVAIVLLFSTGVGIGMGIKNGIWQHFVNVAVLWGIVAIMAFVGFLLWRGGDLEHSGKYIVLALFALLVVGAISVNVYAWQPVEELSCEKWPICEGGDLYDLAAKRCLVGTSYLLRCLRSTTIPNVCATAYMPSFYSITSSCGINCTLAPPISPSSTPSRSVSPSPSSINVKRERTYFN
eukprot:TRINITY_DN3311_c0_g1_i1.p1 TRINITY_DN3311_c0_g1~~TRINITY_DN3311_c0_g1_i1.p1  ORF type:complete len:215 (-),score=20.75 TRINITY_DN3311_c0_g1_i1:3-623(-)